MIHHYFGIRNTTKNIDVLSRNRRSIIRAIYRHEGLGIRKYSTQLRSSYERMVWRRSIHRGRTSAKTNMVLCSLSIISQNGYARPRTAQPLSFQMMHSMVLAVARNSIIWHFVGISLAPGCDSTIPSFRAILTEERI